MKNNTIWTFQEENSYNEETERIEKYIASGGNIDDILYYYDYESGSFHAFFPTKAKHSSRNEHWDSGIYLFLVVFLFLFFIIFTLRGKCKRNSVNDAAIEQGRFHRLSCIRRTVEDSDSDEEKVCLGRVSCCKKKVKRKLVRRAAIYNLNEKQKSKINARRGQEKGKRKTNDKAGVQIFTVENEKMISDELKSQSGSSLYTIEECTNEEEFYGNLKQ